jgi:hypothetical protein
VTLTTTQRFGIVLTFAIILSAGGIPFAAFVTKSAQDGGRGGALAVALSFAVLFLSRGYGTKVYDILTKEAQEASAHLKKIRGKDGDDALTDNQKLEALLARR